MASIFFLFLCGLTGKTKNKFYYQRQQLVDASLNPTDRSYGRLRSAEQPQTPSDLRRQRWTPHLHTWTLKSPLWSHTYFLEFSQAICRQRQDGCIETHVSRLTHVHLKCFLTVPSSYIILLLCRTQGCRESWKSKQISQVGLIHLLFVVVLTWLKSSNREWNKQQCWKFHRVVSEVLDVPVRRVCHRFLYQQYHHML